MHTLRAAGCATVTLSLLFLTSTVTAGSAGKSATMKPATADGRVAGTKQPKGARHPAAGASNDCAPCAAQIAQRTRGRSHRKSAKAAKKLECHPKDYLDPKIASSYKAALRDMKHAGIRPRVTSVWRSSEGQAQLHKCSLSSRCRRSNPGLYRAMPAGKSMHEAGFAVDITGVAAGHRGDKHLTPRGKRIVGIMKKHGFNWRYGLADPVHFEADPRKHGYRDARQAITRTQTTCQVRLANSKLHKKSGKTAAGRSQAPDRTRMAPASEAKVRRHSTKSKA